jgi:hypothetical protein
MPRLSIVIPALAADGVGFEDTLAAVLRNQPDSSEIIAVHDGGYQDAHDLRSVGVRLVQVAGAVSTSELFVAALSHCRADLIHCLRAGSSVDEGWADEALAAFADRRVAAATPLIVAEANPSRLVAAGVACSRGFRPRLVGRGLRLGSPLPPGLDPLGPTLWAAFYRLAPLRAAIRSMLVIPQRHFDLEVALCLRELELENRVVSTSIVSLEHPEELFREYTRVGGRDSQQMLWRHFAGSRSAAVAASIGQGIWELACGAANPRSFLHGVQRIGSLFSGRREGLAAHRTAVRRMVEDYTRSASPTDAARRKVA